MKHIFGYIGISVLLFLATTLYAGTYPFGNPRPVPIDNLPTGYGGTTISTEEPFISRDGRFLFFNTWEKENNKDLHYAEWKNGRWLYRGEIGPGVNSAKEVEGNPTMDAENNFFYIDSETDTMARRAIFRPSTGSIANLRDEHGIPERIVKPFKHLIGNIGVEVSADGDYLYFSRATWKMFFFKLGPFQDSDLLFARRQNGRYVFDETEAMRIMQNINTPDMEYAASISGDGLELFFTRTSLTDIKEAGALHSQIMHATRSRLDQPFSQPQTIDAIGKGNFVEGPSIGPHGKDLYYHKREGEKFKLYKVTRRQ